MGVPGPGGAVMLSLPPQDRVSSAWVRGHPGHRQAVHTRSGASFRWAPAWAGGPAEPLAHSSSGQAVAASLAISPLGSLLPPAQSPLSSEVGMVLWTLLQLPTPRGGQEQHLAALSFILPTNKPCGGAARPGSLPGKF